MQEEPRARPVHTDLIQSIVSKIKNKQQPQLWRKHNFHSHCQNLVALKAGFPQGLQVQDHEARVQQ